MSFHSTDSSGFLEHDQCLICISEGPPAQTGCCSSQSGWEGKKKVKCNTSKIYSYRSKLDNTGLTAETKQNKICHQTLSITSLNLLARAFTLITQNQQGEGSKNSRSRFVRKVSPSLPLSLHFPVHSKQMKARKNIHKVPQRTSRLKIWTKWHDLSACQSVISAWCFFQDSGQRRTYTHK